MRKFTTKNKRNKFLTELIGEHWYPEYPTYHSCYCDFSTEECFFKLWSWMHEQVWFYTFCQDTCDRGHGPGVLNINLVNPDILADVFYTWYKSGQHKTD